MLRGGIVDNMVAPAFADQNKWLHLVEWIVIGVIVASSVSSLIVDIYTLKQLKKEMKQHHPEL